MRGISYRLALPALTTALFLLAPGCGSEGAPKRAEAPVVRISEHDFKIKAPSRVRAGAVDLAVRNHGPDTHELIVVRTGNGRLPTRSDGTTINEEAVQHQEAGALAPGQPGAFRHLRLHLKPGRYELFCNMAGHYFGGMHARLQVG